MKQTMIILIAIVALVALSVPGCLEDKVVEIVLTGETYADFSEDETGADQPETALINVGGEIDSILIDNGYSKSDIEDAFVTAVFYGVTSIPSSQTHDWTLSGAISVRRVDLGGSFVPIVNYASQSVQAALGQKIAAPLEQPGVDVVNQAMDDFLADVVPPPVLEFQVQHSSITPTPTPSDPMVFEWRAWLNVQLVGSETFEIPDPF